MIDQQPDDGWIVPAAVVTALMDDRSAPRAATEATAHLGHLRPHRGWLTSAREGLAHPGLHAAALACFTAAADALPRLGAPARTQAAVADFVERYVLPSRCPADDQPIAGAHRYLGRPADVPAERTTSTSPAERTTGTTFGADGRHSYRWLTGQHDQGICP